jgi:cytochrome bd-type quinol oxidase subunit 2
MTPMTPSSSLSTVKVRLSDSAVLAGVVSLLYAIALIAFPRAFPVLLQRIFQWGPFFPALTAVLVLTNEILFVLISRRRHQRMGVVTPVYLAFLTVAIVAFFRLFIYAADPQAQPFQLIPRISGRIQDGISSEERLVYMHLITVAGIFLPYLLVRVTENYVSDTTSEKTEVQVKAQDAVAAQ